MMTTKTGIKYGQEAYGIVDGMPATWRFAGRRGSSLAVERIIAGRVVQTHFVDRDTAIRIFGSTDAD